MNEILFEVLKAVVIITMMLIVRYGVPYLREKIAATKYAAVVEWVEKAVHMAEQTITGSKTGSEKKAIVVDFIKRMTLAKNISISDEQINMLIEAAVFGMKRE